MLSHIKKGNIGGLKLGYLVCDKCGGQYKLKEGENPDDFEEHCECGGKLEYFESLSRMHTKKENRKTSKNTLVNEDTTSKAIKTSNNTKSGKTKYLLVGLIIVLVVGVSIAGYFLYQKNRMDQMDALALESNKVLIPQLNAKVTEANDLANSSTSPDYNKVGSLIDEAIDIQKKVISNEEQAYQYADGPYKELISLGLKKDRLRLDFIVSWRSRIEYLKQGQSAQALQLLQQEQNLATEITKADNEYLNFKSTHPEVKEHTIKFWNSPV